MAYPVPANKDAVGALPVLLSVARVDCTGVFVHFEFFPNANGFCAYVVSWNSSSHLVAKFRNADIV